jgi:hypothetical protein
MKIKSRLIVALTTVFIFTVGIGVAGAASVGGGALYYDGGQTGTYVYSKIYDKDYSVSEGKLVDDDGKKFNVKASVKVCSAVTSTEWLPDYAYESEDRTWYCNESSYYDYRSR